MVQNISLISAMESRDHFENGVSSKILTNRENFEISQMFSKLGKKLMKMTYFYLAILILLFLLSCKERENNNSLPVIELEKVFEKNTKIKLSDFSSKIEIIQLETSDDILINRISNIVLSDKNIIIVHDNQCSVFDLKGNFIRKISSRGQGPQEYITIRSILLTDEIIRIFDRSKILAFNLSGEFLSSSKSYADGMAVTTMLDDHLYICVRPNLNGLEKNRILFFNKEGVIVDSIPHQNQYKNPAGVTFVFPIAEVFMYRYNNAVHLKEMTNDTLFSVSAAMRLTPLYVMDVGRYTPKEDERFQINSMNQSPFLQGKKVPILFLETDSYFIMRFGNVGLSEDSHVIYNKSTAALDYVVFQYGDEERNRFGKEFFSPAFLSEDKQVLISYETSVDINNDDNPALVLVTLK